MTNLYDMVSGRWQNEPRDDFEVASSQCPDPGTDVEVRLAQSESFVEAITTERFMPPDLAEASVAHFLRIQAALT